MTILSYRDLDVWTISMQLAEQCYTLSRKFPRDERYALALQVRRCATSIPANIAEGHGRTSGKGYLYHLNVAQGSLNELTTLLLLSLRLGYLKEADFVETRKSLDRVAQMLSRLIKRLKVREAHTRTPDRAAAGNGIREPELHPSSPPQESPLPSK